LTGTLSGLITTQLTNSPLFPVFLSSVCIFQVLLATGVCGSNIDYVTDLADFLRSNDFKDDHLFELESILLEKLKLGEVEDEIDTDNSSSMSFCSKESSSASSSDLELLDDSI